MEKFATENLILLEFLVDQINMDFEMQKDLANIMGETCVSFQFLDNSPLQICEQDFSNKGNLGADQNVKSGKSCLFSLTPEQAQSASRQFDIYVEIFKKMQPGVLPDKIPVGTSLISIVNLFNELVESITASGETPAAKTLKDCFKITNNKGDNVGHISVYIRMSCFGKLIVTQFQMNLEDKSVQFKAKEGHYLFKYNKGKGEAGKGGGKPNQCADFQRGPQSQSPLNPNCPRQSCDDAMMQYDQQQQQQQQQQQLNPNCPMQPCPPPGSLQQPSMQPCPIQPCPFQPAPPPQQAMPGGYLPQPGGLCGMPQMPQLPCDPPGYPGGFPGAGYPGANYPMNYPPLTGPLAQTESIPCNECQLPPPQSMPGQNYQGLPAASGAYQEIGAQMGGNALTIRVHKDKAKIEEVTESEYTESDDRSCYCTADNYSKKRKKLSQYPPPNMTQQLAMRPGVPDPNTPFSFKMAGCGQAANNNVIVNPPTCTAKDGTVFTEISDPNKDVFVLRIGKKSEGVDKKNNLELELCTPKGPEIKPQPKKETRDTQYDEADCPDAGAAGAKGGKKGKGGKGKGGKGGKKGKKK